MRKLQHNVLTGIGFSFLVAVFAFAEHGLSKAGPPNPPAKEVIIDNPPGSPVPVVTEPGSVTSVSGSVAVTSLPTVTVGNAVAIAGGIVGIDPMTNLVRNANEARQPVQIRALTVPFPAGNPDTNATGNVFTVPAGKRLVIEDATMRIIGAAGSHALFTLSTEVDNNSSTGGPVRHYLKTVDNGLFNNGLDQELMGVMTGPRFYADPGTTVSFTIYSTGPRSDASCYISGYLVDL